MIIKDVDGRKLELSKTQLREDYGADALPRYLELSDLRNTCTKGLDYMTITRIDSLCSGNSMEIEYNPKKRVIGCRTFSPATFAKILKAAGVKPKPVRKTNKRKVAR